jgi:E3 ubiquitin-protein ligase RBBP6
LDYDTITFDGLAISLADLKKAIMAQKKFAKVTDFDLEVTDAQTKKRKEKLHNHIIDFERI